MLNRFPRTISTRYLHTIVLVLIAGSLMSFAVGQRVAHGARSASPAFGERVHGWVMSAPHEAAATHAGATIAVASHPAAQPRPAPTQHHDKHHGGDNQGGGGGGDHGGGGN